jgi:hypothetical protein
MWRRRHLRSAGHIPSRRAIEERSGRDSDCRVMSIGLVTLSTVETERFH